MRVVVGAYQEGVYFSAPIDEYLIKAREATETQDP
jgi:hypothetical protein